MAIHNDFGKEAEVRAVNFLLENGYSIKETNWRFHKAEIDIIAIKENILAIVEVKARNFNSVLSPEEAVSKQKIKLLIQATDAYVIENDLNVNVRFDIISVRKDKNQWKINHIEDAFDFF